MDEEDRRRRRINRGVIIPDLALRCVMPYIDDPWDRDAVSLVCKAWHEIDKLITRKHITIPFCYSTTPELLMKRFPHLESLKVKGKPRAAMFDQHIPEDWGGYAAPWINQITATGGSFKCIKSLHFRRMIVTDEDLELLAESHGHMIHTLKLDICSGFSTNGLLHVAQSFICLKTLFLEKSKIEEPENSEWLHELALNNKTLEQLNIFDTELCSSYPIASIGDDLHKIAQNCPSLVSVKINECEETLQLIDFFRAATVLEEFGGGSITVETAVAFPPRLCSLGLTGIKDIMPMVSPFANRFKKLDLFFTKLNTEEHCELLRQCPNLEVLQALNVIGDSGLEVLAQHCKKLRRLRIERSEGMAQGEVSQRGLSALARGCVDLEYIAVYVSDITNACLETIGTFCKNLRDFRLVLNGQEENIIEVPPGPPLDDGVRALLSGCQNIRRFALCIRPGDLTNEGLRHVGQYGNNVRWMLLGYVGEYNTVGEYDTGLVELSRGCPNLQKLELKGCFFSEGAVARSVMQLTSLRYLWMDEQRDDVVSLTDSDLLPMVRPYWNIEYMHPRQVVDPDNNTNIDHPAQILAYYSLAGQRTDHPATVVPLDPKNQ